MKDCLLLVFANKQDLPGGEFQAKRYLPRITSCPMLIACVPSYVTSRGDGKAWSSSYARQVLVCSPKVRSGLLGSVK